MKLRMASAVCVVFCTLAGWQAKADGGCGPWSVERGTVCLYGDSHDGVRWMRSCGVGTVCPIVKNHPFHSSGCAVERICLPRGVAADDLYEGCLAWEEFKSVSESQACGHGVKYWTREHTCETMGYGYPEHFCSAEKPYDNPVPPYTKNYFDPDDFSNNPNLHHGQQ